MRRFTIPFAFAIGLLALLAIAPELNNGHISAQFATDTPPPEPVVWWTATPRMTNTPSITPTNTATFTPTFTPTLTPSNTPTPTNTPSPTPTPNGPLLYPEGVNPLTGKPYQSEEAMNRRNLIVKISNFPPVVRPQTNINLADVVFEVEAEGGVTRFAAIFRENAPEKVGSVRSARLFDTELINMYDALLAYSGTSEPIQNIILTSDFVFQTFSPLKGDNEEAGFTRIPREGLAFEHTLFLDTTKLYERADLRGVNIPLRAKGFAFADEPGEGGLPANDVYVNWFGQTSARWQYDEETGRYLRFTDGVPHLDAATGEQLWTNNLIIIEVAHNERPDLFPPGSNYQSLEIALFERDRLPEDQYYMRATVVRDGQFYTGYWQRRDANPGSALQLVYSNNQPIMLKPGRSWVSVVRAVTDAQISEDLADMAATGTAIALTPTATPIPTNDGGTGTDTTGSD